jgi:glutathionylspermidine synthase
MEKEKIILCCSSKRVNSLEFQNQLAESWKELIKEDGRYEIISTIFSDEYEEDYLIKISDYIDSKFKTTE